MDFHIITFCIFNIIFHSFLSVCNWDVGKAQAVIAQRKLLQSPSGHNAEAQCPLVVPAQGTSDPAAVSVQTNSSYGADSVQSLPKSADMSKNPDETPGMADCRLLSKIFYFYLLLSLLCVSLISIHRASMLLMCFSFIKQRHFLWTLLPGFLANGFL